MTTLSEKSTRPKRAGRDAGEPPPGSQTFGCVPATSTRTEPAIRLSVGADVFDPRLGAFPHARDSRPVDVSCRRCPAFVQLRIAIGGTPRELMVVLGLVCASCGAANRVPQREPDQIAGAPDWKFEGLSYVVSGYSAIT